jgi:hypothetical protein
MEQELLNKMRELEELKQLQAMLEGHLREVGSQSARAAPSRPAVRIQEVEDHDDEEGDEEDEEDGDEDEEESEDSQSEPVQHQQPQQGGRPIYRRHADLDQAEQEYEDDGNSSRVRVPAGSQNGGQPSAQEQQEMLEQLAELEMLNAQLQNLMKDERFLMSLASQGLQSGNDVTQDITRRR